MAINLRDYSRTGAQRGWGAGWPSCGGAKAAGTAVVTAARSGTRFSVHKRIARLVSLLVDECERRGYLLKAGQTGGYNCRPIGGTSSPSNHSWGLAIDINWLTNPMRRPLTTDIPTWMVELFNRYGFAWGGHYSGTPDAMHFEFMGTPADADAMTALALRGFSAPTAPAPSASTRPEVVMNTEQNRLLVELHQQLVTGPDPGRWGWDAWPGGSRRADGAPDRFTTIDYLRKANQAMEDLRRDLATLRASVGTVAPTGPPKLTAADHDAIARRVLALLTEHPLAPKGT